MFLIDRHSFAVFGSSDWWIYFSFGSACAFHIPSWLCLRCLPNEMQSPNHYSSHVYLFHWQQPSMPLIIATLITWSSDWIWSNSYSYQRSTVQGMSDPQTQKRSGMVIRVIIPSSKALQYHSFSMAYGPKKSFEPNNLWRVHHFIPNSQSTEKWSCQVLANIFCPGFPRFFSPTFGGSVSCQQLNAPLISQWDWTVAAHHLIQFRQCPTDGELLRNDHSRCSRFGDATWYYRLYRLLHYL